MAQVNMPQKKDGSGSMFQALQAAKTVYDMSGSGSSSIGAETPGGQATDPTTSDEEETALHRRYAKSKTSRTA